MTVEPQHKRKLCFVTGSRAEYGLLAPVMTEVQQNYWREFEMQIVATGSHLSSAYGMTVNLIERDGFKVNRRVEMLLSSDTDSGIAKSMGLAMIGFSDAFSQLSPDLVIVLGDRYEILAAVSTCLVMRIPVAHLCGGDITEGAFDNSIRHSISKMAHLHFPTCKLLAESTSRIFTVGNPGLDDLPSILDSKERCASFCATLSTITNIELKPRSFNFLVIFHPTTLQPNESANQFTTLLESLNKIMRGYNDCHVVFIHPNSDNERDSIERVLNSWVKERNEAVPNSAFAFSSLHRATFLQLLRSCSVLIGNSSAGIYEAPLVGVPTVNIGDRQKGRLHGSSVIDCDTSCEKICQAIDKSFEMGDIDPEASPYYVKLVDDSGNRISPSRKIAQILSSIPNFKELLMKPSVPNYLAS